MFTGMYPFVHGIHETRGKGIFDVKITDKVRLLSETLHSLGYTNFLLSANPFVTRSFGFGGFKYYYEPSFTPKDRFVSPETRLQLRKIIKENKLWSFSKILKYLILQRDINLIKYGLSVKILDGPVAFMYGKIKSWPFKKGGEDICKYIYNNAMLVRKHTPFFMFINMMEVHDPYFRGVCGKLPIIANLDSRKQLREKLLNEKCLKRIRCSYMKEVVYASKILDDILEFFEDTNLLDNTLLIVSSDHGQLLGDYGRFNHGIFLYDELISVPLYVRYPDGKRIDSVKTNQYISLKEIYKLILGYARSRHVKSNLLYSDTVFAESYGMQVKFDWKLTDADRRAIEKLERYKLAIYHNGIKGVFDVQSWKFENFKTYDPNIDINGEVIRQMKKEVVKFLKTTTVSRIPKIKI